MGCALTKRLSAVVLCSLLTYCGIGVTLAILTGFEVVGIPYAAAGGIMIGAAFAVCFGITRGRRSAAADIQPIENVTWLWRMGLIGLAVGIGASFMFAFLVSLISTFTITLPAKNFPYASPFMMRVFFVLMTGLIIGLPVGAAGLLLLGFRGRVVRENFSPNSDIRSSLIYSLLGAGAFGCLGALILGPILASKYATSLIFLRRAGGAYIFIHRSLMEHLAKRTI
jgi:hypothetical protein